MATISIADSDARVQYTQAVTANSTTLTIDFPFFSLDDINVIVTSSAGTDTTLTRGTGTGTFAVSGTAVDDGFSGGNITLGDTYSDAATKFTIFRDIPVTRTTDFPTSGPFNISALNTELDKLFAIEQELETKIGRTMKLADSDTAATLSLPNLDTRKGTTLAFNTTTGLPEAGPKIGDVSTIAAITADIAALADIEDGTTATDAISGLAAIKANVTTVAGISSNVTTVAGQTTNMQNITDNLSAVQNAATNATTATTKASEAATSATNAASSATSAASSATTATTKASEASTSATNAASSASTASGHKDTATTKASEAASSATAAAASATTATTQASTATTQATTSTTKAGEAATSATASATSATASATSATASASSATAAAASQTAAAASAASAASAFDNFDDTYLGAKSSNPTQDNDGNSLVSGALYFNSTANEMRVYDGANWIAATSAGNVSLILYEYTATSGQTTFSGSDDNSATLSYTVDNLQVVMNGVILDPSDYTATNGTSVVLAAGAATNDLVNIYAFKSFTTADMVSKSAGGTFAGNVTVPQLNADNLRLDGNTISSTDTNGNVTIDPAGTGDTIIASGNLGIGDATPIALLTMLAADGVMADQYVAKFTNSEATTGQNYGVFVAGGSSSADESFGVRNFDSSATYFKVRGDGNVGINNASPGQKLHVHGAAEFTAHDNNSGGGGYHPSNGLVIGNAYDAGKGGSVTDDRNSIIWNERGLDIDFGTSNTYRMKLDYNGNMMVGTTSASGRKFSVESSQTTGNVADIRTTDTGNYNARVLQVGCHRNTTNGTYDHFACTIHGQADKLLIKDSGQVQNANGSYTTISDSRMKENITDASSQWDDIKAVRLRNFNMIGDDLTQLGVVAQELEASGMTGLVGESNWYDVTANPDNEKRKYVKQSILYMKALGALQEAIAKIESLETRVAALEAGE
nr:gp7 [uncultured Mediterranean phage uvMED]